MRFFKSNHSISVMALNGNELNIIAKNKMKCFKFIES